jgi:hypothetical protein
LDFNIYINMLIQRSTKKKNTESFVKECILKNNNYDYSLVEYKNNKTKVKIICEKHGVFEQNYCKYNNIKLLRISYKDDIKNKMRDVYY